MTPTNQELREALDKLKRQEKDKAERQRLLAELRKRHPVYRFLNELWKFIKGV